MVSLSNQARLLAAQAFNKQVLEQKARDRQAKIEAERREDLLRTTRRLEAQKASARNVVEARRIQNAINERLRSSAERERRAKINAEAKRKSANVFTRVSKGANIGVLTGFEARKDTRGRAVGISKRESKTRLRTKSLLRKEIARQQKIAREGTDLERFLRNEQAINQGRVSSAELKRQIADRKRRGLSKTPAQKRASQFFRDTELRTALSARAKRKGRPDIRATFGQAVSERARARQLGSVPFADPVFTFGGRKRAEQVARGGTFGRRAGGEAISTQLSFISQAKSRATTERIGFAQGLLANLDFEGSSQSSLLNIVGQKKLKTPKTFQARLREGVGFFTTEAIPVTKAKLSKAGRQQLVSLRKAEDFAKTEKARKTIARQARSTTQNVFDLEGFGRGLDAFNLNLGRSIEQQNILAPPRFGVTVQRQQAQAPREISFLEPRDLIGLTPAQIKQRENRNLREQGFSPAQIRAGVSVGDVPAKSVGETRTQQRLEAEATQRETEALRQEGLVGFVSPALVPATGQPSRTETFFPSAIDDSQAFSVDLSESVGFSDIFSPTPTRAPPPKAKKGKKGKKTPRTSRSPTPTPRPQVDGGFGILDISSLISFDAPQRQRVPTKPKQPAPKRQQNGIVSGVTDFLAIGGSGATDLLLDPIFNPQSALRTGDFGAVGGFSVDLDFDIEAQAGSLLAPRDRFGNIIVDTRLP